MRSPEEKEKFLRSMNNVLDMFNKQEEEHLLKIESYKSNPATSQYVFLSQVMLFIARLYKWFTVRYRDWALKTFYR